MNGTMLAFLGTSTLVIVTPGPDTATVIRSALRYGRRGALLTPLGVGTAILAHATVAAFGLSSLLGAAAGLYTVVKLCGAAYLLYLGIQSLRSTRGGRAGGAHPPGDTPASAGSEGSPYGQGFLSAILNPKLVVFFATFLPQFLIGGQAILPRMLLLGVAFDCMVIGWLIGYGLLVTRLHAVLSAPAVRRAMERATGIVLVALGLRIAREAA
jgi:threonine/homoserine/homoserine lactone efflux protein